MGKYMDRKQTTYFNAKLKSLSLLPNRNHVFISWHNLTFTVPAKPTTQKQEAKDIEKISPMDFNSEENRVQKLLDQNASSMEPEMARRYTTAPQNRGMKTILHNLSGYAKPGEMIALMGGSGCGKSSFLNVLGQRLALSPGCKQTGEVRANNRILAP
mmetsp:Transcript_17346/g.29161  ORF Transcript_17346/g.29161 Transcript_17346/m.29161 type:complete len:157 (+) Transcript_17346:80-550(+)